MTAKSIALSINKNLKAKKIGIRWQVFDGEKPYSQDCYSPQTAWYKAKIVAICPFKVGDRLKRYDGKILTLIAHSVIGCPNHLIDDDGRYYGFYESDFNNYEKL